MPIRYFKKEAPANKPILANGISISFSTLDFVTGYFATDNGYIHAEFERFMRAGEFGISEISADEYVKEYLEKKNQPKGGSPWREEFAPSMRQTQSEKSSTAQPTVAAAAVAGSGQTASISTPTPPANTPPSKVEFQPQPSRRKRGNTPAQ